MTKENLQTLSDKTLWGLAKDAYNRQADSSDLEYKAKQLNLAHSCLSVLLDRKYPIAN